MAVQKNKKSRSKRDTRRAHDSLTPQNLSIEKQTDERHIRHHISPTGFYKGKRMVVIATKEERQQAAEE